MAGSSYEVTLSRRRLPIVLLAVAVFLLAAHAGLSLYNYRVEEIPWLLRQLFDLDEENNLPTWFSSFLLLVASALLFVCAQEERRMQQEQGHGQPVTHWTTHWTVLAIGFLLMSVDEVAGVHETINSIIVMTWAIPGAIFAGLIGLSFIPFLLHLPRRTAVAFAIAGAVYLSGAVGVEILGNSMVGDDLEDTLGYTMATLAEESLEMFGVIGFIYALLAYMTPAEASPVRPNVVLIIADDHGHTDFGFTGSPLVSTPHLDRLARGGTVFTTAYNTSSTCRPSLLTLLTGLDPYQYAQQVAQLEKEGVKPRNRSMIHHFQTLPRRFKEAGYTSFQAGKLWEGRYTSAGFDQGTKKPGADLPGHPIERASGGTEGLQIGRSTMQPVYEFLDTLAGDQPFLLWFAPMLPHIPHDAPREFYAPYPESKVPSFSARKYYANVTRFDAVVGDLVAQLERRGLRERTLIVFLADNGWHERPEATFPGTDLSRPGGPRGKGSMYELGFRTPLVFNLPGRVPAGAVHEVPISTIDVFPTLLDYAGLQTSPQLPGRSLRPLIDGDGQAEDATVIGHMDVYGGSPAFFVRNAEWHYIWFREEDRDELYAIASDPEEEKNVADQHPEAVEQLRYSVLAWEAGLAGAPPLWNLEGYLPGRR